MVEEAKNLDLCCTMQTFYSNTPAAYFNTHAYRLLIYMYEISFKCKIKYNRMLEEVRKRK